MKKRLLVVTTIFPNPHNLTLGAYNREIIAELSEYYDIDVVVPIPWTQRIGKEQSSSWTLKQATVHHPTFFYPPGCFYTTHDAFYYYSILGLVKQLQRERPFYAVVGIWLFPDGSTAKKLAHEISVPYFIRVMGTDVNRLTREHPLYAKSMEVLGDTEKVFCNSKGLQNKLVSLGVQAEKIFLLRNGVNKQIFFPRKPEIALQALGISEKHKIVLYVGNLKREKGVFELLAAFAEMTKAPNPCDVGLYFIGEGPAASELRRRADVEGISDSVIFLGRKSPEEVALWMNAAALLSLPSYSEGMPNVVLEALSCNTPVVATAIEGVIELAEQDPRITLVPPKEVGPLADALITVLNNGLKSSDGLVINSWAEFAGVVSQTIGGEHHGIT
jgi:glycosyltransferase involved in cell wall biosynthesis